VGRLFDAVSALVGLRERVYFEGQAAMELEFCADLDFSEAYPFDLHGGAPIVIDWEPAIRAVLLDNKSGLSRGAISARFHNMLVETIVAVARKAGESNVVLTGGCFQNRLLMERAEERLREENFRPYWHQRIPPNDGGIALGQAVATSWSQE
jgi:hydrogenase maturation protein HypF